MSILLLKRRTVYILAGSILAVIMLIIIFTANHPIPSFNLYTDNPLVVLDAGHGGVDRGTSGGGVAEKEINLDIVLKLANFLGEHGIAVELTRTTDIDLGGQLKKGRHRKDLQSRVAKLNKGLAGVSVHVNSGSSSKEGAVIFYPKENEEGKRLAELVLKEISKVQVLDHDNVIPRSNLYILKNAEVPTILIEIGFITNAKDKAKMTNPAWRQQMAEAMGTGVLKFLVPGY